MRRAGDDKRSEWQAVNQSSPAIYTFMETAAAGHQLQVLNNHLKTEEWEELCWAREGFKKIKSYLNTPLIDY